MPQPTGSPGARERADVLLVKRGFFESRARAQAAIAAGLVSADGAPVRKASDLIAADASIAAEPAHPYVSRGALKLIAALDAFGIDPRDRVCLDLGASTGGFTEVLLERGAARVYAVDVGRGQLHPRIRGHRRVVSLESTDARALDRTLIPEPVELIVADVSFISLRLVLPAAMPLLAGSAALAVLVKPQFEAGRADVHKGLVRDEAVRRRVCREIEEFVAALGCAVAGVVASPIEGGDGNREYLLGAHRA